MVRVVDPVAGGDALVVIDVGSGVNALAFFADPATGELQMRRGCDDYKVRIFNPVAGGEALVVLEGHTDWVRALTVFEPGDGRTPPLTADRTTKNPSASGTWRRAVRCCSCAVGSGGERADGLRGPGDGRDAARERVGRQDCGCGTRARVVRRCEWFLLMNEVKVLTVRGDTRGSLWLREAVGGVAHREWHDATDACVLQG